MRNIGSGKHQTREIKLGDNKVKSSKDECYRNEKSNKSLRVIYANSRSLGNKINELRAIASSEKPDLICISETWMKLENKHFKAEFVINGYKLFNTDRIENKMGGGVAIYIKDSLKCRIKNEIKTSRDTETIWMEINNNRESLILGLIYRPPNLDRLNSNNIFDEITRACRCNKVCIVGDFNYRNINWENLTGDAESDEFLEIIQDNFLNQYVLEPTRGNNVY